MPETRVLFQPATQIPPSVLHITLDLIISHSLLLTNFPITVLLVVIKLQTIPLRSGQAFQLAVQQYP